ncbi:MAG: hypothetical protein IJX62_09590 [Clostridia bacterium]|nr:hypothetical protein [Clostridia bacterium]
MKTKRLSLLLAFIMILSVFSGTFVVNAETPATYPTLTATDKEEIAKGNEWKIGDTYYADWATASAAAEASETAITLYLLTDTAENIGASGNVYEFSLAASSITIEGVTQEDGSKPVMKATGYRWFTVISATNVTVRNIETTCGSAGSFQLNAGTLTLVDVNITSTVASIPYGIIVLTNGTDLVMNNSSITSSSDMNYGGAIFTTAGSDVTLNGSTITLHSSVAVENTHWSAIFAQSNTHKIKITGSIIDISGTSGYRIIYAGGSQSGIEVTLDNSVLIGSHYSYDLMQAGSGSTVTVGDNVLLVGGGDRGNRMIFRNVAIEDANGTDASTTYRSHINGIDITTSNGTNLTNAELIAQLQAALGNVTKDELATMLGYRFRTTATEDAAYADGAFTGYIKTLTDSNTGTLYQLGSYYHKDGGQWTYTADTAIIGINNPGFYVKSRLFSTNGGDLTLKDLKLEIVQNTYAAVADDPDTTEDETKTASKGGTFFRIHGANDQLTLDNVYLTFNHFDYGLIETKGTVTNGVINIINSNITAVTGGYATATQNLVHASGPATINITNSSIDLIDGNGTGKLSSSSTNGSVILTNSVVKTDSNDNNIKTLKGTNAINGYTVTAPAAGATYNANLLGNEMLYGSAVRVAAGETDTDLSNSGLRFMSTISKEAIAAAGENATFGTVIFRYSDYTAWMDANAGKTMADFIAAAGDSTHKVVNIQADKGKTGDADTGYTIFAALVKIQNFNTNFGAVSYITTADGTTVYSQFDTEDNVRNIIDVATKALADTKTEKSEEIVDGFKYNVEVKVGETYYVKDGDTYQPKTHGESDAAVYSPYTSAQRKLLLQYLANN